MKPTVKTNELNKPKVDLDYTKTRPKRLNKFEKVNGMKVKSPSWIEKEKSKALREPIGIHIIADDLLKTNYI